jgi:hypothetical protein
MIHVVILTGSPADDTPYRIEKFSTLFANLH